MPCRKCDRAYADLFHLCSIDIGRPLEKDYGMARRHVFAHAERDDKMVRHYRFRNTVKHYSTTGNPDSNSEWNTLDS